MRFVLLFIALAWTILQAQTDLKSTLRIAILPPDAPMLGQPQALGMAERFEAEWQASAKQYLFYAVPLDSMIGYGDSTDARQCHEFECALRFGRMNQVDLVIVSRIDRSGSGYQFESAVISTVKGVSVARTKINVGASLGELEHRRPGVFAELVSQAEVAIARTGLDHQRSQDLLGGTPYFGTLLPDTLVRKNSPYLIYGTVLVPADRKVHIESGVEIRFVPSLNGGITVFGELEALGTLEAPIRFVSAAKNPEAWDWRGILIGGLGGSHLNYVEVAHANTGIQVENSGLVLQNSQLHLNSVQGIYTRNAQVEIADTRIENGSVVGLLAGALSSVKIQRSQFTGLGNAVTVLDNAQVEIQNTGIAHNDRALVLLGQGNLKIQNCQVEDNLVALSAINKVPLERYAGFLHNGSDFQLVSEQALEATMQEPGSGEIIRHDLSGIKNLTTESFDSNTSNWSRFGNVELSIGNSWMRTSNQPGPLNEEVIGIEVAPGELYPNSFYAQGLWGKASLFLTLEKNSGSGLEITGDLNSDSWVRASANPLTLRWWTPEMSMVLGDQNLSGSPIFLNGQELLGTQYRYQNGDWSVLGFAGESRKPFAAGDRNADLFAQETDSIAAISQELLAGGSLYWQANPAWGIGLQALRSKQLREKMWGRGDIPFSNSLAQPIADAKSIMANVDWKNASGNLNISFELGIGQADTAEVLLQQFLDEVLSKQGLGSLTVDQARLGDSTALASLFDLQAISLKQAKDSVQNLLESATQLRNAAASDTLDERTMNLSLRRLNSAQRLSARWNGAQSSLLAEIIAIGKRYHSPGAKSLGQNQREYRLEGSFAASTMWDIESGYSLLLENVESDQESEANLLGFGEGTFWGLGADRAWQKDRWMENDREKFTHQFRLNQRLRLGNAWGLQLGYSFTGTRQPLSKTARASIDTDVAVALDPWFKVRQGLSTSTFEVIGNQQVQVDRERWNEFATLAALDSMAWAYMDRRDLHVVNLEAQLQRGMYSLKFGVGYSKQWDHGDFQEQIIADLQLQDSTWGKLGVLPQSQSWTELRFPLALTADIRGASFRLNYSGHFRDWIATKEHEYGSSLQGELTIPMLARRLELSILGDLSRNLRSYRDALYFFADSAGNRYDYYRLNGDGIAVPVEKPQADDILASGGEEPTDGYWLARETMTFYEHPWSASLTISLRWNVSTHCYVQATGLVEESWFEELPSEEYKLIQGSGQIFYSF